MTEHTRKMHMDNEFFASRVKVDRRHQFCSQPHIPFETNTAQSHNLFMQAKMARRRKPRKSRAKGQTATVLPVAIQANPSSNDPNNNDDDNGPPPPPPTPWEHSTAKRMLHDDIVNGETKKYRGPTGIYYSRTIYQRYPFKNFSSNYYSLRKAINGRLELKEKARAAYQHDHALVENARSAKFYYPGSLVEKQLRFDVQKGFTKGKTASEVLGSRKVFEESGLSRETFSNCLSAERRRHERMLNDKDYRERMRFINARIDPDGNNGSNNNHE